MKNKGFAGNLLKIAAAASLALALTGCGSKAVNISDYVTVEYEGYDTVGKAVCTVDFDTMIEENLKAFDLDEDSSKKAVERVKSRLTEDIKGELDKTSNLSNGDEITFEWDDIDVEDIEEDFPVKITFEDKVFVVENLEEPEKFDPFEYVTVTYTGIAPDGQVKITVDNNIPVSQLYFEADNSSGLSNGDVVKVTAKSYYDDMNQLGIAYGMIPSVIEKEYTVEGLSSYAMALSDIPEETLAKLDAHAQDTLNASVAKNWADAETLLGIKFKGNYFLTPKDASIRTSTKNYIYFIYEITAQNMDTNEPFTYYYYSYYTDIMILDDGTCSFDLGTIQVPNGSMFFGNVSGEAFAKGSYYYKGYEDLDSLFNKQVTSKIDSYKYESTVE